MVGILDGDRATAGGAIKALSAKRHARWLPWTTYMRNFLPVVGARPSFLP